MHRKNPMEHTELTPVAGQTKQVDKTAYHFEKYAGQDRFVSYHAQLAEIVRARPESIMEVGVGDGVVGDYLKRNTNIAYTSLDIADDVGADVLGSVTALPFPDKSFDVTCAFEVLEHLPFDQFDSALAELARVARKKVLVSIPHFGPPVKLYLKIPFFPALRFGFKIPYPRVHVFNGQHYWEVGKRGYSVGTIRKHFEKRFVIEKEYVPFDNQYHRVYALLPKEV